ncbi:MAG: N,N-dimethylformamidase beta subunit family domain-containing protein [Devosia sp.]
MRCKVEHRALAIAGFVEPWTGGPGSRSLSVSTDRVIEAVRLRRLDRDGMPEVDWAVRQAAVPGHEEFARGAWAAIEGFGRLGEIESLSFELLLTRNDGRRVLVDGGSFSLLVIGDQLLVVTGDGETWLTGLPTQQWLRVVIDWGGGELSADSLDAFNPFYVSSPFVSPSPTMLVLCSDGRQSLPTLNCRLARLALVGSGGVADWVFPSLFTAEPLVVAGVALRTHGNPTFCVTSARWDGSVLDARLGPEQYDAVHFHDTDMAAPDWPVSYTALVPEHAESGVYAFELVAGEVVERVPFFVAPPKPEAALLFVAPTSTYLAYADEYLPSHLYEWIGTDRGHLFARDNELRSLYDYHGDGSGVSLISSRKPKATLRDDYTYPLCGDPHNLPVDLHFLKFCARNDIAIDVVTDAELHAEGAMLLQRYRGVVTGSHPEYLSVQMEQGYRDYIAMGGRLAYMGGNGFAAAVAYRDDLMELRRGPTQSGRTWDGPVAEMGLALTNEPGGYLRDRGRGEYRLVGVGISLMGFSPALPYTRTEASHAEAFAWLFEGVAETFGGSGIVQGGAAGYEVDAVNHHLGSPDDIVVLAAATGFPPSYVDDPGKWFEGGAEEREAQRRADMTIWTHGSGGTVFSASSVSFLGALPGWGEETDVGKLTLNLLRRYSALD